MKLALVFLVIWKWTSESFIGVWRLHSKNSYKYVNILPKGSLKLVGLNHSRGYWEKRNNQLTLGISDYGKWKLYNANIHHENQTNVTIKGDVLSGQTDSCYEGKFYIEPVFFQFHNVKYETEDNQIYHNKSSFLGLWLLENDLLTSDHKTEKSNDKMRKHVVKRIAQQEDSRIINTIFLKNDNTWFFCDTNLNPIVPDFRGIWGMYNDSESINFNSAIMYRVGKGIWLKSNMLDKVYIMTNTSFFNFSSGVCVYSYDLEPETNGIFHMKKL